MTRLVELDTLSRWLGPFNELQSTGMRPYMEIELIAPGGCSLTGLVRHDGQVRQFGWKTSWMKMAALARDQIDGWGGRCRLKM